MEVASLGPRRLTTQDLFEELKHSQHPTRRDRRPYVPGEEMLVYRSARDQATQSSIAVNVRKRNQRGNSHVVPAEFKLSQMTERGSVATTAPLLAQQLRPLFDPS